MPFIVFSGGSKPSLDSSTFRLFTARTIAPHYTTLALFPTFQICVIESCFFPSSPEPIQIYHNVVKE